MKPDDARIAKFPDDGGHVMVLVRHQSLSRRLATIQIGIIHCSASRY